jgi:EgtB-related family protein
MHSPSVTSPPDAAWLARCGDAAALGPLLRQARADTLATFAHWERALPDLAVPADDTLNRPLWELGHIGWFQTRWLERQPLWRQGVRADPDRPLRPARAAQSDACFDSTRVAHAARWGLALPAVGAVRDELDTGLASTLALLAQARDAQERYFFHLVLLHEDMHHEAALYMARALGVPLPDARWQPARLSEPAPPLALPAARWRAGCAGDIAREGFAFDNEVGVHEVELGACEIDAQPLRWAEFLPFLEAGGYADSRWWTPAGWHWLHGPAQRWRALAAAGAPAAEAPTAGDETGPVPRYLRRRARQWQTWRDGRWQPLVPEEAACHLSGHEAQAWCRWAGRRLPTEHEWERAACTHSGSFAWGEVWEWTHSAFAPFPGFEPHPYREYSAPWFDGRPVLKGASCLTQPRMRHTRYRNFFGAHRHDVPAGFRSCAA